MKRFLMSLMIALLGVTVVMSGAEARRLGGGGSFGKSSPSFSRQYSAPQGPNQMAPAPRPASPAAPAPSPWKGIVGGALLGLGMGALLSHFGLGGEVAGLLGTLLTFGLIALAVMFIIRLMARKTSPQPAYASGPMHREFTPEVPTNTSRTPEIGSNLGGAQSAAWQSTPQSTIPEGFDVSGFLRLAKTHFIRMQAAWDRADVNDIREFTTPEMFAELKMQLTERGASPNHTDVVSIDAEMLGVETNSIEHVASVRFHGMIREAENAPAEAYSEIWVLTKPVAGNQGWLLAGLQQA